MKTFDVKLTFEVDEDWLKEFRENGIWSEEASDEDVLKVMIRDMMDDFGRCYADDVEVKHG